MIDKFESDITDLAIASDTARRYNLIVQSSPPHSIFEDVLVITQHEIEIRNSTHPYAAFSECPADATLYAAGSLNSLRQARKQSGASSVVPSPVTHVIERGTVTL